MFLIVKVALVHEVGMFDNLTITGEGCLHKY